MRDEFDVHPVQSDVNELLSEEQFMFDTTISDVFNHFRIKSLLKACNIIKRTGHSVNQIIFDLFLIPFLAMSNVFLFVRSQYEQATSEKNRYYRFLENAKFNWRLFILNLSHKINQEINQQAETIKFFVLDDTIIQVTGKLIECVSYVYDHVSGKAVLGFQKLVLGIFNGAHFLPISHRICSGSKTPNAKSNARKYKKIPKSERIAPDSAGAVEREQLDQTKLKKAISMLKEALKKGFDAQIVLFDSWFCFNRFIMDVTKLGLHVICQLKNMPRTNRYLYKGNSYSLKELFAYYAKSKLRMVKKYQFKRAVLVVSVADSEIKMKIVFVQNQASQDWHAFASTNTTISAQKILEYYSQRWSIEVFFKNCKQYLNFGKEQMSNLDSIIACNSLVFIRYMILTYLAHQRKASFYERFSALRKSQTTITFGMRLLKFFLNKLQFIVQQVCNLIENKELEKALKLLKALPYFFKNSLEIVPDFK